MTEIHSGHFIVYYKCGVHVRMQCRCPSQDKRKVVSHFPCPKCRGKATDDRSKIADASLKASDQWADEHPYGDPLSLECVEELIRIAQRAEWRIKRGLHPGTTEHAARDTVTALSDYQLTKAKLLAVEPGLDYLMSEPTHPEIVDVMKEEGWTFWSKEAGYGDHWTKYSSALDKDQAVIYVRGLRTKR